MAEIYRVYSDELRRFLLTRTRSPEDAEDLVQETFYRVQRQARDRSFDHVRGYLYRTARNLLIDRARRQNLGVIDRSVPFSEDDYRNPGLPPDEVIAVRQEYKTLCEAVMQLSPQVRRVVILNKFQNLSYKEISRVMKISPKTVENHLARGVLQCRHHLQNSSGDRDNNVQQLRPRKSFGGGRR